MFYKSKIYSPTTIKKKIQINNFYSSMDGETDDSLKSPKQPNVCFNFNPFDGSLKGAEGLSVLKFNGKNYFLPHLAKAVKVYFYKRFNPQTNSREDKIICYVNSGYMYSCPLNSDSGEFELIDDSFFEKPPIALSYNYYGSDVMLFAIDNGSICILDDNTITRYLDTPKVLDMCIHKERLFATTSDDINTIWFSGLYNPVVWDVSLDGAGYVTIPDERGKMLKIVSFYDYVYLFREYGITRIYAYGDQTEFSVDNLYLRHGKIYGNSVTVCGDYIVFLASDGLYRFDGVNAVKLLPQFDEYLNGVENSSANGTYFNNRLYMSISMRINNQVEKVILVYDFKRKAEYVLKGFNLNSLVTVSSERYFLIGVSQDKVVLEFDNSSTINGEPVDKIWQNNPSNYGIDVKNKKLYKFTLDTDYLVKVIINCDGDNYYYTMSKYDNELNLDIVGNLFNFTIISETENARVASPTLYFSYVKERLWLLLITASEHT